MKTTLTAILAALALVGCSTTPQGTKVPDVATMQVVAKSAAYIGGSQWLLHNPGDRETFVMVRDGLDGMIAAGTFDAAQLTQLLQQLPIKELKGDSGTLIVDTAVVLWDSYGRQLVDLDKALVFKTYILPVAQSILDGLNMALK